MKLPSIEEKPLIPMMFCDNPNCFLHKAFIGNPNIVTIERFDTHTLSDIRTDVRRTSCLLSLFSGMTVMLCDYCRADAKAGKLKWSGIVENAYRNTKTRYYDSTFGNALIQCPTCGKDIGNMMQYRKKRIRDAQRKA